MNLKDRFAQDFQLRPALTEADDHVLSQEAVDQVVTQARALEEASPPVVLTDAQREDLTRKRTPLLADLLRACAAAAAHHPDLEQDLEISEDTLLHAAHLDEAALKLVKTTGDAYVGSGDAVRVTSGEARRVGEQVLHGVHSAISAHDPALDIVELDTAFAVAFQRYRDAQDREAQKKDAAERAVAAERARQAQAEARQQAAHTLTSFTAAQKSPAH